MKTISTNISLILLILMTIGCVKKEAELRPAEGPEPIYGDYTLPQGNHEYDNEIAAFYKKYNTLILYKYEPKDIYWNISNFINQASYDVKTDNTTKGYMYIPADENYIRPQLDLLKSQIFKYFPDDFIRKNLPRKIFLMDKYRLIEAGKGTIDKQKKTEYLITSGIDYLGLTGGGPDILLMTAEQKRVYRGETINFFLQRLITDGTIQRIAAFTNLTNYSLPMPTYEIQYGNGIIDWNNRQPSTDWDAYLKMLITTPYPKLIASGGFWHPGIDNKGTIRKKSDVMINYFKNEFNIDLQAIANDL
jgi:hypothetical protein